MKIDSLLFGHSAVIPKYTSSIPAHNRSFMLQSSEMRCVVQNSI